MEGEELDNAMRLLTNDNLVKVFMHSAVQWSMFTIDAQFAQATRMKKSANAELLRRLNEYDKLKPKSSKSKKQK